LFLSFLFSLGFSFGLGLSFCLSSGSSSFSFGLGLSFSNFLFFLSFLLNEWSPVLDFLNFLNSNKWLVESEALLELLVGENNVS